MPSRGPFQLILKGHRIFLFAGSGGEVPEVVQEQCPHMSLPTPAKHRVRGALELVSVGVFLLLEKTANRAVPWDFWWPGPNADQRVDVFPLLSLGFELNVQVLSFAFTASGQSSPCCFPVPCSPLPTSVC